MWNRITIIFKIRFIRIFEKVMYFKAMLSHLNYHMLLSSIPHTPGRVPMEVSGPEPCWVLDFRVNGNKNNRPFCWVSVWNCLVHPGNFIFHILVCNPHTDNSGSCLIKLITLILIAEMSLDPTTTAYSPFTPVLNELLQPHPRDLVSIGWQK